MSEEWSNPGDLRNSRNTKRLLEDVFGRGTVQVKTERGTGGRAHVLQGPQLRVGHSAVGREYCDPRFSGPVVLPL
jgi:hypothetical protein